MQITGFLHQFTYLPGNLKMTKVKKHGLNPALDWMDHFIFDKKSQDKRMNWIILIIAGLFEVAFAFCLGKAREATGTEMFLWYAGFLAALVVSMGLLIKAAQTIPIGTAYAVWTGIGAVGTVMAGVFVFKEPATFLRLFFLATLIASIIGLKAVSQ